jgi:ATP-dependent Clp protease ATP-binding subunit ClpA
LLRINEGVAIDILKCHGIDPDALRSEYETAMTPPASPKEPKLSIPWTPAFRAILKSGEKEAARLGFAYFGTEHLLLGFLSRRGLARDALSKRGFDLVVARSEVAKRMEPNKPSEPISPSLDRSS